MDGLRITDTGITATATTGSGATAVSIPTLQGGNAPIYVRIAATGPAFIKFGGASVVATVNDVLLPGYESEIINVQGCTKFAVITVSGSTSVNVIPLGNG